MFGSLKEKLGFGKKAGEVLYAPIEGETVELSKVSDPTFGQEILGKGVAILPSVGKVYAPIDGTVEMVFDTKHAITMRTDSGMEILIHVGLDTVTLNGAPFTAHVAAGDKVKAGDLMLDFDIEAIQGAGLEIISPIIICNTADYSEIQPVTGKTVTTKDTVMTVIK